MLSMESIYKLSKTEIVKSTFLRIDEYQIESFKQNAIIAMQTISTLAGIKGEISLADKTDILKLILKRFKALSFEEVYIAFEMERYNEYDEKTEHFNLFNADYVSKILNKYQKWKIKYKSDHNLSIENKQIKIEPNNEEYYEIIYSELKEGITNKASIYFNALAKLGEFKIIPKSEYLKLLDSVFQKEIKRLKASQVRADRERAKRLMKNGKDAIVVNKAKDIVISQILSKLNKEDLFKLLEKCDKINQNQESKNPKQAEELVNNLARNTKI